MIVAGSGMQRILPGAPRPLLRPGACAITAAAVASPPTHPRRRHSLVSWPLYRLLLIVSLIPLALAALALRNVPVPPEPVQPIAVSGSSVVAQSRQFIASRGNHNCCAPGTPGELAAAR